MTVYEFRARKIFKCKGCEKQFSATSGTVFASRKLDVRTILAAIAIFVNGAKGYSALQLSRDLDVQYKTAFVLAHKLREVLGSEPAKVRQLKGAVEIDSAYFGGYVKPANYRENRRDRRLCSIKMESVRALSSCANAMVAHCLSFHPNTRQCQ